MTKSSSILPKPAIVTLILLLLGGCAGIDLNRQVAQTPEQALELAQGESERADAQRFLLRMAGEFQDRGNHQGARTLLRSSQLDNLPQPLENQRRLLAMASAIELEDADWARTLTADAAADDFLRYPDNLLAKAARLQANTQALAGEPVAAASTLILLGQTDGGIAPQALHDQIWQYLKSAGRSDIEQTADQAIGFETEGWLKLAADLQAPDTSLDDRGRIVRRWQNQWPSHPAAQVPPTELALLADLATSRPEHIVLALPFQGPLSAAGKAIRDGFLAAYYSDETVDREETDIRVLDTSDASFAEHYRELVNTRTDLIVGPLEKEALAGLSAMNTLPVPVLGLNYLPEDKEPPSGLYQYGLSAEDEARQIADRLAQKQLRNLLVLIPEGGWGDRVLKALQTRANERQLRLLDVQRFSGEDNLRTVTADLLGITRSRDRAIGVERTIGMNVEFEPRRRQDAQSIVLVASPTIARQFKPLFAFYYGGDLPVYSPSIIYEGSPNPTRDRDLNRITFTDIPWVLEPELPLRSAASQHLPGKVNGQLGRLFAMGADAWQLSKRLVLLQRIDDASIDGMTGVLTMTPEGAIHRQQLWARIKGGVPELLSSELPAEEQRETETQTQ